MYFSKFPIVQYPLFNEDKLTFVMACNILRRIALSESITDGNGILIEYNIKDGERPEHIAERIYGNPNLHWIVLLSNTIIDPYHGWYKSGNVIEQIIQKKYSGYSVFFTNSNDGFLYSQHFGVGGTLSQGNVSDSILNYESSLCKFVVASSGFVSGEARVTTTSGTTHDVKIQRISESYVSVNHFKIDPPAGQSELEESFVLDPLSEALGVYSSVVDGVINLGAVVGTTSSNGAFSNSYIGKYMGLCGGTPSDNFVVSNNINEMNENDKMITIKILHPRYKDRAVKELESMLRV